MIRRLLSFLGRTWLEIAVQAIIITLLFYRPVDLGSRALEDYFFKWLNVSAAALWAHIGRKALFPYMDLAKMIREGDDPGVHFFAAWYAAWIIGWSLGG